jgi:spore coat protein H
LHLPNKNVLNLSIMKRYFLLPLVFLFTLALHAQDPTPPRGLVFDDDAVQRVDILIDPDDLDMVLDPNDPTEYPATFIFTNGLTVDTVENIGFRLRGNTSLFSDKKSFKVSFNTFVSGQDYKGLEKMNLNGEHNDPSVIRSKVCWDILRDLDLPGARANHVELWINGDYYGVYINVEHIDEEFVELRFGNKTGNLYKCLYPATLEYLGPDPDAYKFMANGRRVYDLKTNTDEDDYSDLAELIGIFNLTSDADFACEIEKVFNVDDYLRYIAFDIVTGNWDGPIYNINNFYLYHNSATGKFEYIPYDLDNTLGIDWLDQDWGDRNIYNWEPSGDFRVIYERFMANDMFREQFTYYMEDVLDDAFSLGELEGEIDATRTMIAPFVENDPFYPLDYGFTYQQFLDSYDEALSYFHTPYGLKPFIDFRHDTAQDQMEEGNISPIISRVTSNTPNSSQAVNVTARVQDDGSLQQVQLCYSVDQGAVECVEMFDDGDNADGDPNDGVYGVTLPALNTAATFNYTVEAIDNSGQMSVRPYCDSYELLIPEVAIPIYINELMASNSNTIADEFNEYDDWVELYYAGTEILFIGGMYLTDDLSEPDKWSLPDIFLDPNTYLLLWMDDQPSQGDHHAPFKLSADGEEVGLFNADLSLIDQIVFPSLGSNDAFGRIPDAIGPFEEVEPTPGAMNVPLSAVFDITPVTTLTAFPNPNQGTFILDTEALLGKTVQAQLIDARGATLWMQSDWRMTSVQTELNFELPTGIYYLHLQDSEGDWYGVKLSITP